MLLGIPIIASGNMTLESGLRDCVLGSSWFIISAFVHFLQAKWGGCSAGFKAFSRSGRVLEAKRKREELQVQQEDSFAQED